MTTRSGKPKINTIWLVIGVLVVVVILAGAGIWHNLKPTAKKSPETVGHQQQTAVNAGPSHDTTPSPASSSSATAQPIVSATPISNPSHPVTASLAAPVETLNNDGGTACGSKSCAEDSTCNSVVGASCYIEATMGAQTIIVTKTATTDSSGGVDLPWSASQLSAGTWNIQAVATYNGSKGMSDPEQLTVQ
jgi:cytoskeletal protein RodZ